MYRSERVAVKRSQSAGRMLKVFETIAGTQPTGVSALARALDADKSAIQRDLMTLADAGWIRPASAAPGQWELTPHVLTLARPPQSADSLRQRARPSLERLRGETGETAYLTIPDGDRFVVLDALESDHVLRMVPPIGMVVQVHGSATARAVLPWLPEDERARLLGAPPSEAQEAEFEVTRNRGYAVNDGDIAPGAVAMASAVFGPGGVPIGTLVLTAPTDRLPPDRRAAVGALLQREARLLSGAEG